jgi:CBS domain-containing protein
MIMMLMRNQPSVLVGVFNTIGQIEATNSLWFHENTNGLAVALDLLELRSAQTTDAAVLDDRGQHLGSIDELDVMRVLDEGGDLNRLRAKDIMRKNRLTVTSDTPIMQAAKMMEKHRIFSLPVERNGQVTHSVRCHDLLRARIGLAILDRNLQFRNNL